MSIQALTALNEILVHRFFMINVKLIWWQEITWILTCSIFCLKLMFIIINVSCGLVSFSTALVVDV